jgi:Permuted papain-like amidase enzyme, YaeF/YiiX, C92 family
LPSLLDRLGHFIARQVSKPTSGYEPYAAAAPELVAMTIRPVDVLLVEGSRSRVSSSIRYLTQSTWSHAALYVGLAAELGERDGEPLVLVEAEIGKGVIASPLSKYNTYNTRICRPVGLTSADREKVIRYAVERIGYAYDLKNILDLIRFLLPRPPVPARWRRRMIALGSGDPTRAICSTLIAQAFEAVKYPILPLVERVDDESRQEILHIRHHSLYTPRDFDISPFFAVVKPTIEAGFDYRRLRWAADRGPVSEKGIMPGPGVGHEGETQSEQILSA